MRLAPVLLATCGLALAGGFAYVARDILRDTPTAATPATAPDSIVLIAAKQDIPFGAPIERENLIPQTWPRALAPADAFDDATALLGVPGTASRKATQTIRAGEVILSSNVSQFGANVTIGSTLAPGTRAVAIRVNTQTAVGGFVSPGDRVDIVLTQGRGDDLRTGVILEDTRILAVDQDTQARGATNARTITVEVSPRDSQRLVLAQEAGQLSLILRHAGDEDPSVTRNEKITMYDVWGEEAPSEPKRVVEAPTFDPTTVRVRRGVASQDIQVGQ